MNPASLIFWRKPFRTKTIKALRFIINGSYKMLVFLTESIDKVTPTAGSKKVI